MSTFVLRREYDLQLPNNYVEIDRDEMEYVDGGAISVWTAGWWIDQGLTLAGIAISGGFALAAIKELARKNANGLVITVTAAAIRKTGLSFATSTLMTVIGKIMEYCNFSAGVAIAKAWDSIDAYRNDGEMDWLW